MLRPIKDFFILQILKKNKTQLQFLLLFLMFFFSVLQVYTEPVLFNVCFLSFFAFVWFLLAIKRQVIFTLYFFLVFSPGCLHFVYQLIFRHPIDDASIEQVFISNIAISFAFLKSHPILLCCIPLILLLFVLFSHISHLIASLQISSSKYIRFLSTLMLLWLIVFLLFSHGSIYRVVFDGYLSYKADCAFVADIVEKKLNTTFSNVKISEDQTVIVVIGESETRTMLSLYGYQKDTTPHLSDLKDKLIVFSDVFSPHSHTATVLDKALSLKSFSDTPNNFGSVIDLFSQAGFEVWWLSTPPLRDVWSGSTMAILSNAAHHKFFLNKGISWDRHDIDLLPKIKEAILQPTPKKLIFVHLLGSHGAYTDRYPESLRRLDLTPYENTIYSTDYFMNEIINFLEKENIKNTKLLYFSDHGDALQCECHTEALGYPEMFEVPFYLWLSPDIRNKFKLNKDMLVKPYNTEHLIHSIADLAKISSDEIDIRKSIFNKDRIGLYVMLNGKQYAISSDLIFEVSHPITRGKVVDFSEHYLKIKWYSSGEIETWENKNSIWQKI